ncbi:MAG TPA: HDOD domain-containing protein, partial [bacterium]|nr:HDOD domain-containing protein [bacterium]
KVVFFMNLDGYEEVINESLVKGISLPLLERERYGIDHQEIGNILGLKWKLPPIFLKIIENHHNEMDNNTRYTDILKLVSCADRFFYNRDRDGRPEIFILKKEVEVIETEIEKLVYIIHN